MLSFGLAFLFGLITHAKAQEPALLREPLITASHEFALGDKASPALKIVSADGFTVYAFAQALKTCKLTPTKLAQKLEPLLGDNTSASEEPGFWPILDYLYPGARAQVVDKNPVILISHFANQEHVFASFYLSDYPDLKRPAIVLDCDKNSRDYWRPSLAHEISHLLAGGRNLPSWLDEMAAQVIEKTAGGSTPMGSIADAEIQLRAQSLALPLPSFLSLERPFKTANEYVVNALLGEYLLTRFGGWQTLQAMINSDSDANREQACGVGQTLAEITCRAQYSLKSREFSKELFERMTPQGLMRFFAAAVSINDQQVDLYSVPYWGMNLRSWHWLTPPELEGLQLAPGQFVLVKSSINSRRLNANLEAHLIDDSGDFPQLLPLNESLSATTLPILILNTTDQAQRVLP